MDHRGKQGNACFEDVDKCIEDEEALKRKSKQEK